MEERGGVRKKRKKEERDGGRKKGMGRERDQRKRKVGHTIEREHADEEGRMSKEGMKMTGRKDG